MFTFLLFSASAWSARDSIRIVGSSTIFPFSKTVAERFGRRNQKFATPTIEATGTGGGFKEFCSGLGSKFPDIVNASRKIKAAERERCEAHGVAEIVEILIGYDGIVLANSRAARQAEFTLQHLFLALAKRVPENERADSFVLNPYKNWSDIDPKLPKREIQVYGPPITSGTRDTFLELAMEGGCNTFPALAQLKDSDPNAYLHLCHVLREDGAYIDAGENDNIIVQKLQQNPEAFGIFGFNFLDQNIDRVQGAHINSFKPDFRSITDGVYPVSRPLYLYVKKAHVDTIPGIREFIQEFTSTHAWGDDGYLAEKGMIPLEPEERSRITQQLRNEVFAGSADDSRKELSNRANHHH